MKRFHVHLHVADLGRSIAFYSKLFGTGPARTEGDYAKWMLEDPRLNFAISTRGAQPGLDHFGLQVDDDTELDDLKARAREADFTLLDEGETTCCYARSDKYWLTDPQGVAWEQFRTLASIPVFGDAAARAGSACCAQEAAPAHDSANDSVSASASASASATAWAGSAAGGCCAPGPAATAPATAAAPRGKPVGIAVKAGGSCC